MNHASTPRTALAALALAATFVHAPASAQSAPQGASPVTVESRRADPAASVRPDLSAVCPTAQVDLPEALASTWHGVGRRGEVTAHLTVDGDRVTGVKAEGGHPRQRWAVRWALSALACQADRPGPQTVAVRVRFADPADPGSTASQTVVLRPAVAGLLPAASAAR